MRERRAVTKYVRISPRKARLAASLIRGLPIDDALDQLTFDNTKGARLLQKTLVSAIANAESQLEERRENFSVKEVRVDEGPTMKRAKARSKGARSPIKKRMSHFTVVVSAEKE